MSRGLDLMMSMDIDSDWVRYSKNEARRKTDYEKHLEKQIEKLKLEIASFNRMGLVERIRYKPAKLNNK